MGETLSQGTSWQSHVLLLGGCAHCGACACQGARNPHSTLTDACHVPSAPPDFSPVFHIKLKDQVLLEGDPATLFCLPAASPSPKILWMKGKSGICCLQARAWICAHRTGAQEPGL